MSTLARELFFRANLRSIKNSNGVKTDVRLYQFLSNFWPFVLDADAIAEHYGMPPQEVQSLLTENGYEFATVEHYFQWRKFMVIGDVQYAELVRKASSPEKAKSMGMKGNYFAYTKENRTLRGSDSARTNQDLKQYIADKFEQRLHTNERDSAMRDALRLKFDVRVRPTLVAALLATGDTKLHEHGGRSSGYWGLSPLARKGGDRLGQLLEERRAHLLKVVATASDESERFWRAICGKRN